VTVLWQILECKALCLGFFFLVCSTDIGISLQEIFGGNAASDEYHIARHVANLFVVQTYEGQSDIHGKLFLPDCVGLRLMHINSFDPGPCHYRQAGLCLKIKRTHLYIEYIPIEYLKDLNTCNNSQ
jgi:glutaryl-CoA dehydrogenase